MQGSFDCAQDDSIEVNPAHRISAATQTRNRHRACVVRLWRERSCPRLFLALLRLHSLRVRSGQALFPALVS